jgi:hypothetical protein
MRRVSKGGAVIDATDVAIPNAKLNLSATSSWLDTGPGLAFDGAKYAVVWAQGATLGPFLPGELYGVLVDGAAAAVDMVKVPFPISTTPYEHRYGDVAFDGTDYRVVWGQQLNSTATANVFTTRVSTTGTVLDTEAPLAPTAAMQLMLPRISCHSGSCVAVWQDAYPYHGQVAAQVRGARVGAAGVVLDPAPFLVSSSANAEVVPSVASSASGSLVVWVDFRISSAAGLFAARLDSAGQRLDPAAIVLAPPTDVPTYGRAATNGTDYLVVYSTWDPPTDTYALKYTRLSAAGVVLDVPAKLLDAEGVEPAVVFDGTSYFVVWHRHKGVSAKNVFGAHVTTAGAIAEAQPLVISSTTSLKWGPVVAAGAADYLVAWGDDRLNAGHADVFAARVTHAGIVRDPFGFAISSAPNEQTGPSVASDGTNFLVTWSDTRNDPAVSNIYAARVDANGAVLDTNGIAMAPSLASQHSASARYSPADGKYVVVWEDARNASSDIYGAELTSAGVVGAPASLVGSDDEELGPETSSELLVYVRKDLEAGFAPRVRARRWGVGATMGMDAGNGVDGGTAGMDAAVEPEDGGAIDAATGAHGEDCTCAMTPGAPSSSSTSILAAVAALMALVRQRRSSRQATSAPSHRDRPAGRM